MARRRTRSGSHFGCGTLALGLSLAIARATFAQDAPTQIAQEVQRYVAALNSNDPRALLRLYSNEAAVSTLGDGEIRHGWNDVSTALASVFANGDSIRFQADSIRIVMLGSDAALAYLRYRWTQGHDIATPMLGAMTLVYRRTSSGWLVIHDHTSSLASASAESGLSETTTDVGPPAPVRETTPCVIQRVVDGDTIDCGRLGRVRLIGMDAPEENQPPFGARSTAALTRLLRPGSVVNLEQDVEPRDRYGRLLAYVWTDNGMANWRMVRDGWAVTLTYAPNVQFVDAFTEAQRLARDERRGLWASDGFACLPVDHRRRRCE